MNLQESPFKLKKKLRHRYFPGNFAKRLKKFFFFSDRAFSVCCFAVISRFNWKISLQSQHHLLLRHRNGRLDVFYKKVVLKIYNSENTCDGDIFTKVAVLDLQLCKKCLLHGFFSVNFKKYFRTARLFWYIAITIITTW